MRNLKSELKKYGYNLVKLPQADIKPLDLLYKTGRDIELADAQLNQLLLQGEDIAYPDYKKNIDAPNELQGKRTHDVSAKLAIKTLMDYIEQMDESMPKEKQAVLNNAFNSVGNMFFKYENTLIDKVNHLLLDEYVTDAILNDKLTTYKKKALKSEMYIVTAVLKSKSITINQSDENSNILNLSLPEIQDLVSGSLDFQFVNNNNSSLIVNGSSEIIFALKAVKLKYAKEFLSGEEYFCVCKRIKGKEVKSEEDFEVELLLSDEDIITVKTEEK